MNVIDLNEWKNSTETKYKEYHRLNKRLDEIARKCNVSPIGISSIAHRFPKYYQEIKGIIHKQCEILLRL